MTRRKKADIKKTYGGNLQNHPLTMPAVVEQRTNSRELNNIVKTGTRRYKERELLSVAQFVVDTKVA